MPGLSGEEVAEFLERVTVFAPLDREHRLALAARAKRRTFAKDEVVFHRDDPSAHLFVIVSGSVKVAMLEPGGHEVVVAIERQGEVFGELALLDDLPRSATITALEATELLTLARADFFEVLEHDVRATRALLTLLARTIRRSSGMVEDLVFLDMPSRVAKCLLSLAERNGGGLGVGLRQEDLAALVGSTRESVNKVLADLEGLGAITVGRRRIEIRDAEQLGRQVRY